MNSYFEALGSAVASAWGRTQRDDLAFPEIAAEALLRMRPAEHVSWLELVKTLASTTALPQQADLASNFGQPPITVYKHRGFHIDLLFWYRGVTEVHQHGFAGAFAVVAGSCVESRFTFTESQRVNAQMLIGELAVESAELLLPGTVQPIVPGDSMIHAVVHLGQPSLSLVVRTDRAVSHSPQFNYYFPHVAIDPVDTDALRKRRLQVLQMLGALHSPLYVEFAEELILANDTITTFRVLVHARPIVSAGKFARLESAARGLLPESIDLLSATTAEMARQATLQAARSYANCAEHRLCLALLATVPSAKLIREIVAQQHVQEVPEDLFIGWLRALGDAGGLGPMSEQFTLPLCRGLLSGLDLDSVLGTVMAGQEGPEVRQAVLAEIDRIRNGPLSVLLRS